MLKKFVFFAYGRNFLLHQVVLCGSRSCCIGQKFDIGQETVPNACNPSAAHVCERLRILPSSEFLKNNFKLGHLKGGRVKKCLILGGRKVKKELRQKIIWDDSIASMGSLGVKNDIKHT